MKGIVRGLKTKLKLEEKKRWNGYISSSGVVWVKVDKTATAL